MKKLVIAEKPSVAQTIAKALGISGKGNGCIEGDDYVVTWCFGHMLRIKDDERYRKWDIADLPIVPQRWEYEPIQSSAAQLRTVESLIRRSDISSIVCATDAGREGELIFRLVYNDSKTRKPAERLWISSLEEASIKEGFRHLKPSSEYDRLYNAALGRSWADWLVGINATRFYSVVFRSPDGRPLTVGRVQTPTLQMIVDREKQIKEFVAKDSYQVAKLFGGWVLQSGKYGTEDEARKAQAATEGKAVTITSIEEKDRKQSPPLLYSLTGLQQDANRVLGFSAEHTLQIAQQLYEKKMLSYPRTDAEYITADMEGTFADIIKKLTPVFYPGLEFAGTKRLVDDSKVSDHYALMLTRHFADTVRKTGTEGFGPDEKAVIKLVGKRMMQAVSPWHEWHETKVAGVSEDVEFTGTGRREIRPGWTAIGKKAETQEKAAGKEKEKETEACEFPPDMGIGSVYMPLSSEIRKRTTAPPKPYTEDTLLGAMEKAGSKDMPDDAERKGLGTSATRAAIIEGLVDKGYITKVRKKKGAPILAATDKAYYLLGIVEPALKDAKLTAEWEWRLKSIEKGKDELGTFLSGIESLVRKLIDEGRESPEAMAADEQKAGVYIGLCPFCGSPVIARERTIECSNPDCGSKLWRNSRSLSGHDITDDEAKKLFAGEWVPMKLYSEKKRKHYTAAVALADTPYEYTDAKGVRRKLYSTVMSFDSKLTGIADGRKKR